ncbi:MAG: hypothetical protein HY293_07065 [Planctomycetes bacterium]|nr:hypothetical protein [Planctomycetota bacterium]
MGFSQADWREQQGLLIDLDRIRFGPRQQRPKPIPLGFLPPIREATRQRPQDKDSGTPDYGRFQLRLW